MKTRRNWFKCGLSLLLSLVMCMSTLSMTVFADGGDKPKCPAPDIYVTLGSVSCDGYFLNTISIGVDLAKYEGKTWTKGYTCYYTTDGTDPSSANGTKVSSFFQASITSTTMEKAVDGVLTYKIIATMSGYEAVSYTHLL